MSHKSSDRGGSGSSPGDFSPPSVEHLDSVLDAYEFIEILGRGGMGAVYKARQVNLDRLVAIKILPQVTDGDELRFAERFQREAQAMGRLSHPNIIGVYDFGRTQDGQLYIVMEYVEGTDLHQLIRTGQLTVEHLFGWFPQICDALQYAHGQGIVHRDIKPANIMINREGVVKVADFGLAKLTGAADSHQTRLTMTNVAMGTPDYVAPEALEEGVVADHRADLYAVGVMLYEILTGKVPRGAWRSPSALKPEIDPRFDALVNRAMDADRETRFQHASEISTQISGIQRTPASAPVATPGGQKLNIASKGSGAARRSGAASGNARDSREIDRAASPSSSVSISGRKSNTGLVVGFSVAVAVIVGGIGAFLVLGGANDNDNDADELAAQISGSDNETSIRVSDFTPAAEPETDLPSDPAPAEPMVAATPPEPASLSPEESTTAPEPASQAPAPKASTMVASLASTESATADPVSELPSQPEPAVEPEDPRLAQLEKGFQAAFEREANGAFLAALAQLDRSYLGAIGRSRDTAQQKGNLDEVTAYDREVARMTDGPGIPPADAPGIPDSLRAMRETYRDAEAKLQIERDEGTAPLYEKYLGALDAYETELTQANEIPKALAVREYRKEVEARKAALKTAALASAEDADVEIPNAMTPPAPATGDAGPKVEIVTSSAYRELATWILSEGGQIRIRQGGAETDIRPDTATKLPNGSFDVVQVKLGPTISTNLTNDDFSRFVGAPNLRSLMLVGCPMTTLPALTIMEKLESVHLEKCPNLNDQIFIDLGSLPALKSLQFGWDEEQRPALSDSAFEGLAASSSIDLLRLDSYPFADGRMALLAGLPALKKLELQRIGGMDGSFLEAFGQHQSLEVLQMAYFNEKFDGSHLAALAGAPNFRQVVANVWELGPDGFRGLGKITQLKHLVVVAKPSVDDKILSELSGIENLEHLEIAKLATSGSGFRSLTCGKTLRYLRLDGSLIDADGFTAICESFSNLSQLILESQRLRADELAAFSQLQSLESLTLSMPDFNDSTLAAIGNLGELKSLMLPGKGDNVTAAGLAELAKAGNLEKLTLRLPEIPEGGWAALAQLDKLVRLETSPAPTTPEIAGLVGARSLEQLKIGPGLADNPDEMVEALKELRALRTLEVNSVRFEQDTQLQERVRKALPGVDVRVVR